VFVVESFHYGMFDIGTLCLWGIVNSRVEDNPKGELCLVIHAQG